MFPNGDIRKTLMSLVFISIWITSSATGGHIFSEVKAISGSSSSDREGRLMRLRTCHDEFMVQCELCEVIRIVNVSYAASRLQYRNPVHGCADLTFQQEFDCRLPAKNQYFETITKGCEGFQSCELRRERSDVSCGQSGKTWSCCVEIYYTCEPKNDLIQSTFFTANDVYGNINNVSLQCQSSALSIESLVMVFNSSGEMDKGEVCYKEWPNTINWKRHCDRRGCSGERVQGDRGCGRDKLIFNHGLYVCYICRGNVLSKTHKSSSFRPTTITPGLWSLEADGNNRYSITTQYSEATNDLKSNHDKTTKTKASAIPESVSLTAASSTVVSSTRVISLETTQPAIMSATASSAAEFTTTTKYLETTESATTIRSSTSQSSSHTSNSTSEPDLLLFKDSSTMIAGFGAGFAACAVAVFLLLIALVIYFKRFKIKKLLLGSSRSSRMQSRKGAKRTRRSQSSGIGKVKVHVGYSYREMSATGLQLNDAEKQPVYENCRSSADCAETGVQIERFQYKGNETKTDDKRSGSNELTESRTCLEIVADDLDSGQQPVCEDRWSSAGSAEDGLENLVPGSSRSARTQSRKGAKHTRRSPSSGKEQVHVVFCYPEKCPICLQLKDARKRQIYEDCSCSTDCAESGVQNEIIRDKSHETTTNDTGSGSDELTESITYLEIVADDPAEEDVDKYLEQVSVEQKEFSNCVEPNADFPKEPNPDYVNYSRIHNVYESLDLSNLPPVYQKLKHSTTGAEGLDKDLERGSLQQNDFRNCVEPIADFPKGPNPDYVNFTGKD